MVHRLERPGVVHSAVSLAPLTASLRYRCECANNEVLVISVIMDLNAPEEQFIYTMRDLWRDMRTEIKQHTGKQ